MRSENSEYILEVEDLSVEFHTPSGVVHAVSHSSFNLREGETLVFVEVKSSEYATAHPAEHVTPWQMKRYVRAAREYVAARGLFGVNVRFDVAEVVGGDVRLIRGAFDATTA